jgi:hypothetical protein
VTPAWRVWRALSEPPRDHPLYRLSQRFNRSTSYAWMARLALLLLGLGAGLLALDGQILALVYGLLLLILGSPLLFFVLGGTLSGAWIAAQAAAQVARWRTRAAALVEVTPLGADGAAWIIGLAQANAHQWRAAAWRYARWLGLAMALLVLFIQASASLSPAFAEQQARLWVDTLAYLSLTLIVLLDHVYSPIQGLLIGLLVGLRPGALLKPALGALLAFMVWQFATLCLGLLLVVAPLRALIVQVGGLSLGQQVLVSSLALVLAFTAWRELLTGLLLWGFRWASAR